MRHALSIAGSDPSGGAGIQADLKTFFAFDVYGMAVLTSLTAQNTRGVTGIHDVPPTFVAAQLRAVLDDVRVDAIKTGMLKTPALIEVVASGLAEVEGNIVVDPVMVATSGDRLIEDDAVAALRSLLFPRAAVVTPNGDEAGVLYGRPVATVDDARAAAELILDDGAKAVLVKGLVREGTITDLLTTRDSEQTFEHELLEVGPTHGSGCTLSSAIAAGLARGETPLGAVTTAIDFVSRAIRAAVPVGGGSVPLRHGVEPRP